MEALIPLLVLYLFFALVVFPIWAVIKISGRNSAHDSLEHRLDSLERELKQLRAKSVPAPAPVSIAQANPAPPLVPVQPPDETDQLDETFRSEEQPSMLGGITLIPVSAVPQGKESAVPPPIIPSIPVTHPTLRSRPVLTPPPPAPSWADNFNWEQFMGAKLFAWLGGLALFLGVAFFVKYSFDHNLIPPELRVAIGFIFGAGLMVGGLRIDRERYRVTGQTLIATGVVSLYAVTFACNSIYHFAFFGPTLTFLLMTLITATAFVLAVRLEAQVVALLGMLGGFLTPVLLSSGQDNPGGLFGYLALLDIGLVAVAFHRRWFYLIPLGAGGTVIMMLGWADKFFQAEKGPVAMTVCVGFSALYVAVAEIARRREISEKSIIGTAISMPLVGLGFGAFFLDYPALAANAPLYFGYLLLLDIGLLRLSAREPELSKLHLAAGLMVFALLAFWTENFLTNALLPWALAGYLGFGALHAVVPQTWQRARPETDPTGWSQFFTPLALVFMLWPILQLDSVHFLIWPAILLVDLLAIAMALISASLAAVAVVLVLTLVATGLSIFRVPATLAPAPELLLLIGGFATFFFVASFWLARRLGSRLPPEQFRQLNSLFGDVRAQLPAFSSLLPFLLLVMVCARLEVPDPSNVFGLALLLLVLTLGLARLLIIEWLPLCVLAGVTALEFAWHSRHFRPEAAAIPLAWYFAFDLIFATYPFVFRKTFVRLTGPWAVAALAGLAHFPLVYRAIKVAWPNEMMGLLPALFSLPPLLSLAFVLKNVPADNPKRLNQLAWFGGAGLFFITLVFPIQFDRQWITLGWALEGAALLWLFWRVPHPGLRVTGVALLITAFVRLTFNGSVLSYHVRGDTALLNWYLYTYGIVIAALLTGARLLAPPRELVLGVNARALLNALGIILAFLLLNIEVADFFTPVGARTLTFQFSGNFARDMSYTIAWALFALGLLVAGIWKQQKSTRYAALSLLGVALLKLFLHDLARLDALYRVGALFAVAIVAILASFAYQRFLPAHEKNPAPQP